MPPHADLSAGLEALLAGRQRDARRISDLEAELELWRSR
jgi:hypothetical protein